jgi:predicted esterase
VQDPIGLVDFFGYRHTGGEVIFPHIRVLYFQGLHECIRPDVVTDLEYFFFVFLHAMMIFVKVINPLHSMSDLKPVAPEQKLLTFQSTHPYETLNKRTSATRRVWVVFHGIGFLSRYFLRYFSHMDPDENYIIAPQAPSLYYLDSNYKNVGASWLTREQTGRNMGNILHYLDALYQRESLGQSPELILMGYSQGVSVLSRWVAQRKITCHRMLLYAGKIPGELTPSDFSHLSDTTPVEFYAGDTDAYLPVGMRPTLEEQLRWLFGRRVNLCYYEGGHELQAALIQP